MSDWFRRWYVPRAEYQKMVEYYSRQIAELHQVIHDLKLDADAHALQSQTNFDVWKDERSRERDTVTGPKKTNVVVVNFNQRQY